MIIEDFKRNDAVIRRERMAGNEGEEKGKEIKERNKRETGEKGNSSSSLGVEEKEPRHFTM